MTIGQQGAALVIDAEIGPEADHAEYQDEEA
jgi:hypothetical protein